MADTSTQKPETEAPSFSFNIDWSEALGNKDFIKSLAGEILENYIIKKRWYAGKASNLKYIEIEDSFKVESEEHLYYGVLLEVNFNEAFFQNYFIPLAFCAENELNSKTIITSINFNGKKGYLLDALHQEHFRKLLFEKMLHTAASENGEKVKYHKREHLDITEYRSSRFMGVEQSNTSIIYNDLYVLKFFRRIYVDTNPDYEINRFLTEKKRFDNTPAYAGSINMATAKRETVTLALMQELIPNQGDAWKYMLQVLDGVFSNLSIRGIKIDQLPETGQFQRLQIRDISPVIIDWVGLSLFLRIQKLALRTAEMHITLGSDTQDTAFTPTTYNGDYTVWLKNRLLYQFQNRLNTTENTLHKLEGMALELAQEFLDQKKEIRKKFLEFEWTHLKSERIRIHGDYHLGQVLVNNDDFFLLDFEGEPESTIRDRKVKQPPMKDLAGMFRSFHYALYSTVFNNPDKYPYPQDDLFKAAEVLYAYMCGVFLETYIAKAQAANLNIGYRNEINFLLRYCMLEKAVYELGYELNSRPLWAVIPLKGISTLMKYK